MFAVQNNEGTVVGANAYIDEAFFRQYFLDVGDDLAGITDDKIRAVIVASTRFVDTNFQFLGYKLNGDAQTTEFPRYMTTIPDPAVAEIPVEVKYSICEYGKYLLTGKTLLANISAEDVGISETYKAVDVIRKKVKYISDKSQGVVSIIPFAEMLLAKSGWLYIRKNVVVRT